MVALPEASGRNLAAGALAGLSVVVAILVPHWTTGYAAALIVFTVWMAWFVQVVAEFLGRDPPI